MDIFDEKPTTIEFENESLSSPRRQYHRHGSTLAGMMTTSAVNLSHSAPAELMRRSRRFQTPSVLDLDLHLGKLEFQNQFDVWNYSSANRCIKTEIVRDAINGERRAEIKNVCTSASSSTAMNGNFYHRPELSPPRPSASHRSQSAGSTRREGTPKDPHSIDDLPVRLDETDHELLITTAQNENHAISDQYAQLFKSRPAEREALDLSELASLTHRLTISEHNQQQRVRLMEKEQLRFMHRIDELRVLLARVQMENEQLRAFIQRLTDERVHMLTDYRRMELQNEALCKECQRQRIHLQDLYFTLSLHGFDYVVLPDGRKVETMHQSMTELYVEPNRRWTVCNDKPAVISYQQSNNTPVPIPIPANPPVQQPKPNIAQSCEHLMRKLVDLQQQRDHLDGYIDWLKEEARKKEHIYDDPFTDDVHASEDDFEQLDNNPNNPNSAVSHPSNRQKSGNTQRPPSNATHLNSQYHQHQGGGKPVNFHDSNNSSPAHHGIDDRRHSTQQPDGASSAGVVHHVNDRRESMVTARSRFLRKDSLLAMLLDSGSGVLSKPRRSIFSRQKPQHNAFVTGRGYSLQEASPKPTRKIRTHIL